MGELYTARGAGYCTGIIGAGLILEYKINITKENYLCICLVILGIATMLQTTCTNLHLMAFEVYLSGYSIGGFDTFCNIMVPEMWGARVQPW